MSEFLGCTVSVKCFDDLGTYQGKIIDLNKNSLTLAKAFWNGIPHTSSIVNLRSVYNLNLLLRSHNDNGYFICQYNNTYNNIILKWHICFYRVLCIYMF